MKIPFRLQTSEYDCAPTTLLNAVSYLFTRDEIPALVIQRIYLYCLDKPGSKWDAGQGGTSGLAVKLVASWLNEFKQRYEDNSGYFHVSVELLEREHVHFDQGSRISKCLNRGGAAALSVTHSGGDMHYILALRVASGWVYCFDPYGPTKPHSTDGYEYLEPTQLHDANIRIKADWLNAKPAKKKFRLGIESARECLIFERHDG